MAFRQYHSSVTIEDYKTIGDAILLIGGEDGDAKTTELIPGDGSAAQSGPFTVRHSLKHCAIKTVGDYIVLTGGKYTPSYTTEYRTTDRLGEKALKPLVQPRSGHACGYYRDDQDTMILLVTGGLDEAGNILSSTETAMYSSGYYGDWTTSNGQLPRARTGLKAAMINSDLYVTGGIGTDGAPFTSIYYWDPNQRYPSWRLAGDLKVPRHSHAAVAMPSSIIESECPALT